MRIVFFTKKTSPAYTLTALTLTLLLVAIVFRSLTGAINIPINHIDGTFQTASGLHRLNEGLCPGKDFLPYLGVGLLYLIYPLFKLAGATVSSSMFAAQALTFVSALFAVLTVCLFCLRGRLLLSMLIATTLLAASMFTSPYELPNFIFDRLQPGQSLRPIRSFAPYIGFFVAYLLLSRKNINGFISAIALGSIAGLCTLWSNDFGLPCVLALSGLSVSLWQRNVFSTKNIVAFASALMLSAAASLTIATCGAPTSLLSYNFIDIAKDQWWYFGPWSDESRIFSVSDFGKILDASPQFGLALAMSCLAFALAFVSKRLEHLTLAWLTVALLCGTLIVTVGGHIESGYLNPLIFHVFLIGIFLPLGYVFDMQPQTSESSKNSTVWITVCIALLIFQTALAANEIERYADEKTGAELDPNRFYVSELGGFLSINWRSYVSSARSAHGSSVEEYWGIWSAIRGGEKIFPVDSVIHALGSIREKAKQELNKPIDQIITTRLGFSIWQQWSMSSNWWLYRHLILNYKPESRSNATVVWQPNSTTVNTIPVDCLVKNGKGRFYAPNRGLYDVTITLANKQPQHRHLLLVRNGLVHAMKSEGLLSLPIEGQRKNFPMLVFEQGLQDIDVIYRGLDTNLSPEIESCQATAIDFQHPDVFLPPPPHPTTVNVSNRKWDRGVSLTGPKILVFDTPRNRERYLAGKTLVLSDRSERQITEIKETPPYLEVFHTGWRLDGSIVGYPSPVATKWQTR